MPTKTTSYPDEQYAYIVNSMGDDEGFSERVQELVAKGIETEEHGDDDE